MTATSIPCRPVTLKEAAGLLGVSLDSIERAVAKGLEDPGAPYSLPSFAIRPGARRILPEAIDLARRGLDPWAAVADTMLDASADPGA